MTVCGEKGAQDYRDMNYKIRLFSQRKPWVGKLPFKVGVSGINTLINVPNTLNFGKSTFNPWWNEAGCKQRCASKCLTAGSLDGGGGPDLQRLPLPMV